jgi:hypothetical protein
MPAPGINRPLFDLNADQLIITRTEHFQHGGAQIVFTMIDGEKNLGELQHGGTSVSLAEPANASLTLTLLRVRRLFRRRRVPAEDLVTLEERMMLWRRAAVVAMATAFSTVPMRKLA